MADGREGVLRYAAEQYGTQAEYPWQNPFDAVLRHADNRKWYGLIMRVSRRRLGLAGDDVADVLNVKCDETLREPLCAQPGILPAYHMSKRHWLTVLLDEVPIDTVHKLLDMSYALTAPKRGKSGGAK